MVDWMYVRSLATNLVRFVAYILFNLLLLGGVGFIVLIVVFQFISHGDRARPEAVRVKCASNMRQIFQGMYLYTTVYGDEFPDFPAKIATAYESQYQTKDGVQRVAKMFQCPSSDQPLPPGPTTQDLSNQLASGQYDTYIYLGGGLNKCQIKPNMVLVYEDVGHHTTSPGANVLFGDGVVRLLTPQQIQLIEAKVASHQSPVTMPVAP